jgi:hypothetical protein
MDNVALMEGIRNAYKVLLENINTMKIRRKSTCKTVRVKGASHRS